MANLTRRNFIVGFLGAASMLGITGCSNTSASQDSSTQETEGEPQEEATKYAVGDTVETDLVKLTLNNACFAIALGNSFPVGCDFKGNTAYGRNYSEIEYFEPKEYTAEDDSNNPYVAPKGDILVYTEMTIENLDRTFLELDSSSDGDFAVLQYDGKEYNTHKFGNMTKKYGIEADTEGNWKQLGVSNLLLSANSTEIYRAYYCYPVDPDNLDEPFEITFQLPKSDDTTESFTYAVNQ